MRESKRKVTATNIYGLRAQVQLRRGVSNGMDCESGEAQPPTLTQFAKSICSVITKSAFALLQGMIVDRS